MTTNETPTQWPLSTAILTLLKVQETAPLILSGDVTNLEGLFAYARDNGVDVKTGVVGFNLHQPDDDPEDAHLKLVDEKGPVVELWESSNGKDVVVDVLDTRLDTREQAVTPRLLEIWKGEARENLTDNDLGEDLRTTALQIIDQVVETLNARLPEPSPWQFAVDFCVRLGDADGKRNVEDPMNTGAFTQTACGFNVRPPGDTGVAGAATVRRFFEFKEAQKAMCRADVYDFGSRWAADFGGIKFDSVGATRDTLTAWAQDVLKGIEPSAFSLENLGELMAALSAFILTAANHLPAAKAE